MSRFEIIEFTNKKGEMDFIVLDRLIKTEQPKAQWLEGINNAYREKFDNGDLAFKVIV